MALTDDQLREAADIFEKGIDERTNPESDKWDGNYAGTDMSFTLQDLATSIISERNI